MILVRYLSRSYNRSGPSTIALACPEDVSKIINILDASEKVIGWQVLDHSDLYYSFGWGKEGWNKHRPNGFTREDYSDW